MNNELRDSCLEVLGIPEFFKSQAIAHKPFSSKIISRCLVVETTKQQSFCQAGSERDLLLKMLATIGIKNNDIAFLRTMVDEFDENILRYQAEIVLITSDDLMLAAENYFLIKHPSEILQNSSLKRPTWEVLKKILKYIKT